MVANTLNTFASLTVQCARCHDHKFDPVTQEDYYSLQAVFAALDRADRPYDLDPAVAAATLRTRCASPRRWSRRIGRLRRAAEAAAGEPPGRARSPDRRRPRRPASRSRGGTRRSAITAGSAPTPDAVKWVQVDLGRVGRDRPGGPPRLRRRLQRIGAGFGFPARFKVEVSDDPAFGVGVSIVADRTGEDVPNPEAHARWPFDAAGRSARYVRVTATRLAPRGDDYIFALAELEVLDAGGLQHRSRCHGHGARRDRGPAALAAGEPHGRRSTPPRTRPTNCRR